MTSNNTLALKLITAATFIAMVTVNGLANALPINGVGTGDVSDAYANLFAPAAITFAIWGLIYLLLLLYVVGMFAGLADKAGMRQGVPAKINAIFALSSVFNTAWIFAWHYEIIWLSLILMIGILSCLIAINLILRKEQLTLRDSLFIRAPFTVYFGWITVATIANVTTFLVAIGWKGFGIDEEVWTVIILLVGAAIGLLSMYFYRSATYGGVILWAYAGIAIKHLSPDFFDSAYPPVIMAVTISLIVLLGGEFVVIRRSRTLTS